MWYFINVRTLPHSFAAYMDTYKGVLDIYCESEVLDAVLLKSKDIRLKGNSLPVCLEHLVFNAQCVTSAVKPSDLMLFIG